MIFSLLSMLGLVPTFQTAKCKKLLNTTMERIKLLSSRRQAQLRQLRIDLVKLLQLGKEQRAKAWTGRIYKELELLSIYVKIAAYCQSVQVKLKEIAGQNACPEGLEEPLAGLCFAASCCADLPELQELREIFAMKYGKRFVSLAQELGKRCLVKEEELEEEAIAENELKQGQEQVLQQQQEQETQAIVVSEVYHKQCPSNCEEVESLTQTTESVNDNDLVQAMAAVQDSLAVTQVPDVDLGTREVALGSGNRKMASDQGRQTRHSAFKQACRRRRQLPVSTCSEEDSKAGEELAAKGQKDGSTEGCDIVMQGDHGTAAHLPHHEGPNQHLVLHVKPPVFSLPPQRPPPSLPPPNRAPPAPPPLRVTSMPSSHYMEHETSYTNAALPLRCSTMAKINQYDQSYTGSRVHPRPPPSYEDFLANFTALKH